MTIDVMKAAYNRAEAAAYIGVAQNTFVRLLISGAIRYVKAGRRIIVSKKELDRFLEGSEKAN